MMVYDGTILFIHPMFMVFGEHDFPPKRIDFSLWKRNTYTDWWFGTFFIFSIYCE